MPSQITLGCWQAHEATDRVLIPMKGEEQEQILLGLDLVLAHLSGSDTPQGLLEGMRSHCAQSVAKDDKLPGFWSLQGFYPPITEPRCFAKDETGARYSLSIPGWSQIHL